MSFKDFISKITIKDYALPTLVVAVSIISIYVVTVVIPDMAVFKPTPSDYATEYVVTDANGVAILDEDGKPTLNKAGKGRAVYVREGCVYCHSQFVRPQDRDFGSKVAAGDYANETPNVLGTSRTGPDLSNEGGKLPDEWHKGHLRDPRAYTPGSIMPSFSFLSDEDMDNLVAYIQTLGRKRFEDLKNRQVYEVYYPEADDEMWKKAANHKPNTDAASAANAGAGIFRQNCAVCHGLNGLGNGPNALAMNKKPANFSRPFFKNYTDETWYYKVAEGVPGTRMPRWKLKLENQQIWYLVAYLKTLPQEHAPIIEPYESIDDAAWNEQSAIHPKVLKNFYDTAAGKRHTPGSVMSESAGGGH